MQQDVARILISEGRIKSRLKELVKEITEYYSGKPFVIISLLKGSFIFLSDFIRLLPLMATSDFMTVSSYYDSIHSTGKVNLEKDISVPVKGKYVLLVDDILDTGLTLKFAVEHLRQKAPREIKVCVFLKKRKPRKYPISVDYCGFEIEDRYVVGYGLDYRDLYRNLPYVAVLKSG